MFLKHSKKFFYGGNFLALWHKAKIMYFFDIFDLPLGQLDGLLKAAQITNYFIFLAKYIRSVFKEHLYIRFLSPITLIIASPDLNLLSTEISKIENLGSKCHFIGCFIYPSFTAYEPKNIFLPRILEIYSTYEKSYIFIYKLMLKVFYFFINFIILHALLPGLHLQTNRWLFTKALLNDSAKHKAIT
jgi:hypothetical protein